VEPPSAHSLNRLNLRVDLTRLVSSSVANKPCTLSTVLKAALPESKQHT